MTCSGYAKKSGGYLCQRYWAKENSSCHKMLWSVIGTLLPCANFGAGRKRHLQVADGGVLQSSGQSQKTLTCAVITTGLDWSPQSHTAWDAGAGRSWWCLGQFYAGLLPVLCCSLLINWCPGTGAARWGHAREDSSAAQHLARTCPLGGHLLQGTIMSKPLRSN